MSATQIINALPSATTDAHGILSVPTDELDRALQNIEIKQRKSRKTNKRDPYAPKRPASAYLLWLNQNRAAIKDELLTTNPDAKITDVSKRAGELWKQMNDDDKTTFITASEELRAKYHDAMKLYKPEHTLVKKSKTSYIKYDIQEIPDAPQHWSGPFSMKYLYRKVTDLDAKHVRIQKSFQDAVDIANNLIAQWNQAKNDDSLPSHWDHDVPPCAGITKTYTGYDLRLGPDLMTTADKDAKGGLASWIIGQYTTQHLSPQPNSQHHSPQPNSQHLSPPHAPKKKRAPRKKLQKVDTPHEIAPVDNTVDTDKPKTVHTDKPKSVDTDKPKTVHTDKPKKVVINKKPTPKPLPVDVEECQEIELERDGDDQTYLYHEQTNKVYHPHDLFNHVAIVEDDGVQFL